MTSFRQILALTAAAAALAATAAFGLAPRGDGQTPVARGRYLVTAMGCNDCHTPWQLGPRGPAPDVSRMLSGHPTGQALPPAPPASPAWPISGSATNTAWAGPWGTSFTANLTPDPETGLGRWTADEFVATLRNGRHQGRGRQLLPPMPFPFIGQLTDADLQAMFAFLQTIPPIANKVPEPLPPAAR